MEFKITINADILSAIFTQAVTLILLITFTCALQAQNDGTWNHKKCAVCLTYDDASNVHLDNVIPLLDSLSLRGTFYVPAYFPGFQERLQDWKSASIKGHELGNHTLFHPCDGQLPGRQWVNPDYDLSHYTMQRFLDEIRMANVVLNAVDGKTQRTFAYPCGDIMIGDSSYVPKIKADFVGARSVHPVMQTIGQIDLFDIGAFMIQDQSADALVGLVIEAMDKQALLVFLFHGVGGEHNINVSLEAHRALIRYLKQNEDQIWIATLAEIAEYVKKYQD